MRSQAVQEEELNVSDLSKVCSDIQEVEDSDLERSHGTVYTAGPEIIYLDTEEEEILLR